MTREEALEVIRILIGGASPSADSQVQEAWRALLVKALQTLAK